MLKKLPKANEIISVYAVIAFMVYGWTLVAFSGKVLSWSRFLSLGEILTIYSYSLLTNFVETLIVLVFILFLCVILPPRLMLDIFVVRSTIIGICLLGATMFNLIFYTNANTTLIINLPGWLVILTGALIIMLVLDLLSRKIPPVASAVVEFSRWLLIFLYLFLPLSFLALILVAIKNLA